MMVFVALAAVLTGAVSRLPRSLSCYEKSVREAQFESIELADEERSLGEARACREERDQVRRGAGTDETTEQYLRGRVERPTAEAKQLAWNAAYHALLKNKYRRAALFLWETDSPDPPPPHDILGNRVTDPRLMQHTHEVRGERGKAIAFAPDGHTLDGGASDTVTRDGDTYFFNGAGRLTHWNPSTGAVVRTMNGPTHAPRASRFLPTAGGSPAADWARLAGGGIGSKAFR
jgi:hypothetical protein